MKGGLLLNRSKQVPAEDTAAFGGIAERFRRAGDLDRAIALCRDGLQKFPSLLSARVTLGWALLDKGVYDEARAELEQVLRRAPDNLAAIRGLAELHDRTDHLTGLDEDAGWHQAQADLHELEQRKPQVSAVFQHVPLDEPMPAPAFGAVLGDAPAHEPAAEFTAVDRSVPTSVFALDAGLSPVVDLVGTASEAGELSQFFVDEESPRHFEAPAAAALVVDPDVAPVAAAPSHAHEPDLTESGTWMLSDLMAAPPPAVFETEAPEPAPVASVAPDQTDSGSWVLSDVLTPAASAATDAVTLPAAADLRLEDLATSFAAGPEPESTPFVLELPPSNAHDRDALSAMHASAFEDDLRVEERPEVAESMAALAMAEPHAAPPSAVSAVTEAPFDGIPSDLRIQPRDLPDFEAVSTPEPVVATRLVGVELPAASVVQSSVESSAVHVLPVAPRPTDRVSPVAALERMLRKIEARQLELRSGSVA